MCFSHAVSISAKLALKCRQLTLPSLAVADINTCTEMKAKRHRFMLSLITCILGQAIAVSGSLQCSALLVATRGLSTNKTSHSDKACYTAVNVSLSH